MLKDERRGLFPSVFTTVWETRGAEETRKVGMGLGARLVPGTVVGLIGDLGSGKTCLAQGICRGLGVREYVTSPSFVLIHEYEGRMPVYHFDLYRIRDATELLELGYEEYFYGDGVCLVEWAERAQSLWPEDGVEIYLKRLGTEKREIALSDRMGKLRDEEHLPQRHGGHRALHAIGVERET